MLPPVHVAAEDARRFLVARHLLAPARSLAGGMDGTLEVFRRWGSVQFDPLAIAGRNHDLVLHARVAEYDPAWSELLYERREIFEAYNKGLSLVLTSEYPWFRAPWGPNVPPVLAENAEVAEQVLERIRRRYRSPRSTSSASAARRSTGSACRRTSCAPCSRRMPSPACCGLARRDGNRRYYDLLERLLPADVLAREVPLEEQMRHKLLSRFRTHGLLGIGGGGDIFGGLGPAKPGPRWPGHPGRTALRDGLVEDGALVPVTIEGIRAKRFVLREEVALLEAPPEPPPSVAFLPPFDPLVWDRPLLGALFDFEYVWELFFPPEKRRFGWYTLPILFRDRFVGRIEPRIDRATGGSRSSASGGRTASSRGEPRGSSTPCATPSGVPHFAGASRLEWPADLAADRRMFSARP